MHCKNCGLEITNSFRIKHKMEFCCNDCFQDYWSRQPISQEDIEIASDLLGHGSSLVDLIKTL